MNTAAEAYNNYTFQMNHTNAQVQNLKPVFELIQDDGKQNKTQDQSYQSLKMRSLGAFASNIAHDFNNIFGTILASSSLLEMNKVYPEKNAEILKAINGAVGRGAELIGQILVFSGKADVSFKPISLPGILDNVLPNLKQTFPKNIKFQEMIGKNIPCIDADETKMRRLVLNLCINACDAMPQGGTITLKVNNVTRHELEGCISNVEHDRYICLSVSDTGTGIEESVKDMIFDPFYSTKGKGRGLGLSVVYGIVKAHHGYIDVESQPGFGSTFSLYFPAATIDKNNDDTRKKKVSVADGGTETILVVEDEQSLLDLARLIFESNGYTVLAAKDGIEAVEIYKQQREKISLVFTDIGLPGLNGREVFAQLKDMDPNVKVIFTSGIFIDIKDALLKDGAKDFIQKPYRHEHVLEKIREVLDAC